GVQGQDVEGPRMTARRRFKHRVRARAARTGESYTAALRHLRSAEGATMSTIPTRSLTIAVAQTTYREDPADVGGFAAAGAEIRALMSQARADGAELIQLPEGALCFPSKRALSSDPNQAAEADWQRFAWDALRAELDAI